jgi:phospholipid/cholesterol/gamma-HCH transport system substrate-binding protein
MMIRDANNGATAAPQNRISPEGLAALSPKRTPRREAQVGLFVILGVVSILVILFTLTDPGMFRGRYNVTALVNDAQGIRRGDAVQLQGVNIGRVRGFRIGADGVQLRLELQGEHRVPVDSRAELTQGGLLGDMVVSITPGSSTEVLRDGDVIQLERTGEGLFAAAGGMAERADLVLASAQQLLSEQTVSALAATAQSLQALTAEMSTMAVEQRQQMAALTASLGRSAAGLEASATRPELARAIARTDSMTIRLDAASASLQEASGSMAALMTRVESGEGTLGRLTADDELYERMNAAVASVNALTEDIRENPRRYINVRVF